MPSETRNLLGIGLQIAPGDTIIPAEIAKAKAGNFDLEVYGCDTSKSTDDVVSGLAQYLRSKKYAAISIGFGVRGNRDLTPLFEELVNTCIEHQPEAKFGFAISPAGIFETCERALRRTGE